MTSDLEFLHEYARQGSGDAFAALVHRHVDLVYSAALRQTRSPQLAEEEVLGSAAHHSAARCSPMNRFNAFAAKARPNFLPTN
jgi:hypothetical protein